MREQIKLPNAGDSITFECTAASTAKTGKWPEAVFEGMDGGRAIKVLMPAQSAERQMTRAALTYQSCVGRILTISRDRNPNDESKPYWGLQAVGNAPPRAPQSRPVAPPSPQIPSGVVQGQGFSDPLYATITEYVMREIVPLYPEEIALDARAVAAMVNTLYINAKQS